MRANQLSPNPASNPKPRRLGRGFTRGKTCGRGHKGYKSRSGSSVPAAFEGGQMPIQRRLPKCGFKYVYSKRNYASVNFRDLCSVLSKLSKDELVSAITLTKLKSLKFVKKSVATVKIIGSEKMKLPKGLVKIKLSGNFKLSKIVSEFVEIEV